MCGAARERAVGAVPQLRACVRQDPNPNFPPDMLSQSAIVALITLPMSTAICWSATKMPREDVSEGSTRRMPRSYLRCRFSSRRFCNSSTYTTETAVEPPTPMGSLPASLW